MVGFLFYRENHPPLVLGFCFSPYRIEPPGLVRIPTGIPKSSPNLLPCGGSCRERPPKVSFLEVPAPFSQFLKNHKDVKKHRFFRFFEMFCFLFFFSLFFSTVFFPTFFWFPTVFFKYFRLRNRGRHWHNRDRHCEIAFWPCGSCDGGSISAHHGCPVTVAEVSTIGSLWGVGRFQ